MKELPKNNPFKTPEAYFDNFSNKVMNALNNEKETVPKEDGFIIPENYFDGLHHNIQQKLNSKETKVIRLNQYKKYYMAAASVAAMLILFFGLYMNNTNQLNWDHIANTDIEAYLDTNELGLSTYEIAEVLPIDELEIKDIIENQFDEENLIDYLNENVDAIEDLNLEDYE